MTLVTFQAVFAGCPQLARHLGHSRAYRSSSVSNAVLWFPMPPATSQSPINVYILAFGHLLDSSGISARADGADAALNLDSMLQLVSGMEV